jgi:DNA-binding MarR family transcriptional regulator
MTAMHDVKSESGLPATVVFRLGTLGSIAADMFAAKIAAIGLKPKHAGLMTALQAEVAASQQELASKLGVAPSLVVMLADHLEGLGAIQRVRDPDDRRRQVLNLTDHGRKLLADCAVLARELDAEFTATLTASQLSGLQRSLAVLAEGVGLPTA